MYKRLLLVIVIGSTSTPLNADMGGWDLAIDILTEIWDGESRFLPDPSDYGVFYGPLNLHNKGIYNCTKCTSLDSVLGQRNAAKFASNRIFGKSRVINKEALAYANLVPYANGVEGLRIRLNDADKDSDKSVIEVRVPKVGDATLRSLATKNGGILTFAIVLSDGSIIEVKLNVKFDRDLPLIAPPPEIDEQTQAVIGDVAAYISGEGGPGLKGFSTALSVGTRLAALLPRWDFCTACYSENLN